MVDENIELKDENTKLKGESIRLKDEKAKVQGGMTTLEASIVVHTFSASPSSAG
jgi:hypothetical protein